MDFKEMLEKVISEKDGLPGLTIEKVVESPCTNPGDNYMSVVSGAEVQGVLPGGKPFSKRLIIKRPVNNHEYGEMFRIVDAFHNEATTYLQIFPLYDVGMPCPRCYHADRDVIVLEDLRDEGYAMGDRCKGFDLKTAAHAVKAIAKFHAASYHANITKTEEFIKIVRLLKVIGINTSSNSVFLEGLLARVQSQIEEEPEFKSFLYYIKPLEGKVQETLKALKKASKIEVLCHGDFWINNILVRPGDHESVKLIDLQASDLSSPAVDVWSFIYTSLELSIIDDHVEELLQLYCKSFVDELTSLNLPQTRIPSHREVMEDLTSRELYGFLIANLYLPALLADSESIQNLETVSKEDIMETFMETMKCSGLKERLKALISICTKRGVFNKPLS